MVAIRAKAFAARSIARTICTVIIQQTLGEALSRVEFEILTIFLALLAFLII